MSNHNNFKRFGKSEINYRRRQSTYECINIIIFILAIFFVGVCLILLKRPEVSEIENRKLAEMPQLSAESYFDGSFAKSFSEYFSDTVPYREQIVEFASRYEKAKGISSPAFYGNVAVVADDEGNAVETEDTEVTTTYTTEPVVILPAEIRESSTPAETTTPAVSEIIETTSETEEEFVGNIAELTTNGIIVDGVKMYGENAGVMLFGGNKKLGTRYAEIISSYKRALGDDVNVYNMVVPTSVEFYLPKKFQKYSSSELDAINHIYQSYTADVIPIDAYSEIAAHTDEYIYLRTDHHWSQRGAYYAYCAFAKALGQTPPTLEEGYTEKTKEGFVGSLYGYTNDITLKNSPELFTYYMPKSEYATYFYDYATLKSKGAGSLFYENVSSENCYAMFIGADGIHTKIVTKLNTGRKICVFKESYGNAFVPYLVDSFDEIYVIDIRFFGKNAVEYIKEQGITDVLFINNAFAANTKILIEDIEKLYNNRYGTLDEAKIAEIYGVPTTSATEAVSEKTAASTTAASTAPTTSDSKKVSESTSATTLSPAKTSAETSLPDETEIEEIIIE